MRHSAASARDLVACRARHSVHVYTYSDTSAQTSQTTHFLNIYKAHVGSLAAHLCGRARAIQRASAQLQRSCCAGQQVRGLPMPGAPHVRVPCVQRCCYQGDVVCQDIMAVHAQDCLQGEGLQADCEAILQKNAKYCV